MITELQEIEENSGLKKLERYGLSLGNVETLVTVYIQDGKPMFNMWLHYDILDKCKDKDLIDSLKLIGVNFKKYNFKALPVFKEEGGFFFNDTHIYNLSIKGDGDNHGILKFYKDDQTKGMQTGYRYNPTGHNQMMGVSFQISTVLNEGNKNEICRLGKRVLETVLEKYSKKKTN